MPPSSSSDSKQAPQRQWRSEQCVAICDYQSDNASEISFRKGDVISVTGKRGDSSGFWEGITTGVNIDILTGKKNKHLSTVEESSSSSRKKGGPDAALSARGLFPTCMVSSNMRAYNEPRFCNKALVLFDYARKTNDEADLCKGDVWSITRPSTSPGWWYGVKEGSGQRVGETAMSGPLNKHARASSSSSTMGNERLIPINFITTRLVVGGLPCQGNASNELPISTGDVLHVIRKWNDGWWEGTLRGKRGIFPSNLVHPNVTTLEPPLFCQRCKSVLQYGGKGTALDGSVGKCMECAEHDRVIEGMLLSLAESSDRGAPVDLFSHVDEELLYGKKFLQDLRTGGSLSVTAAITGGATNLETTTVRRFHATV